MGKNLLVNSLMNSLFIFHAQIEIPPPDFIKIVDAKNKHFLWGGVAKIAHHSIVGDYKEGGIKYKDIQTMVMSVNIKFISRLKITCNTNNMCLPKFWLKQLYNIPAIPANDDQIFFNEFFTNSLNILDCKLRVPRKNRWKGHPYYHEILKSYENCLEQLPKQLESIMSIPIWYNKLLNTTFNIKLAKAGFNYLRDIFVESCPLTQGYINTLNLQPTQRRSLSNIVDKLPPYVINLVQKATEKQIVILPYQTISFQGTDRRLCEMNSKEIYKILVFPKIKLPRGLLKWCEDIELSDEQIKTSLTFAHKCCISIFDRVFQYKIVTQILPTNEYLERYKVKDFNTCDNCIERDSVEHRLYECEKVVPIIQIVIDFLERECQIGENINMINYLFGFNGESNLALNHIILELKKMIFYNLLEFNNPEAFCEHFFSKIRALIIREKYVAEKNDQLETFYKKWNKFTAIYDFRGPDLIFA